MLSHGVLDAVFGKTNLTWLANRVVVPDTAAATAGRSRLQRAAAIQLDGFSLGTFTTIARLGVRFAWILVWSLGGHSPPFRSISMSASWRRQCGQSRLEMRTNNRFLDGQIPFTKPDSRSLRTLLYNNRVSIQVDSSTNERCAKVFAHGTCPFRLLLPLLLSCLTWTSSLKSLKGSFLPFAL